MNLNELERRRVDAAERAVIASIPADLLASMAVADARFRAVGGCKGCNSQIIGVHYGNCPTLRDGID